MNIKLIRDFFSREIKFEGVERELKIEETKKIVSIVGPRRSGKTWYFYYLFQNLEKPMYVNFEDIAFRDIRPEEIFELIKIFSEVKYEPKTLLLDEVQNLKKWEIVVRSLYDRGFKIFITGSSSKLLSKEIATQLRGRSLTYLLLPFSFREFLKAKGFEVKETYECIGKLLKLLEEYMYFGGFPEVVLSSNKERILKEYFDEIFYKDFVERHKIKSIDFGRFLFEFCFQNFSKEISFKKIKNYFERKISDTTLYNYIEKLEDTLSVFFLKKYSKSVYIRSSWPRKVYVVDLGISTILGFEKNIGKRLENIVFLELLRKTNKNPLMEVYYFKDYQQHELDFLIKEGLRIKQLIQVTYANSFDEIDKREIRALLHAKELFKQHKPELIVITWDYEDEKELSWFGKKGKIKFVPLWRWLLSHNNSIKSL